MHSVKSDHQGEHVVIRSQEQIGTRTHKALGCREKVVVVHFSACKNTLFSYLSGKRRKVALFLGFLKTAVLTIILVFILRCLTLSVCSVFYSLASSLTAYHPLFKLEPENNRLS